MASVKACDTIVAVATVRRALVFNNSAKSKFEIAASNGAEDCVKMNGYVAETTAEGSFDFGVGVGVGDWGVLALQK